MDIRPLRSQQEVEQARKLLAPGALDPDWAASYVLMEKNGVAGLFCPAAKINGNSIVLCVEPMHVAHAGLASIAMIAWIDAKMRSLAEAHNIRGYTFTVKNSNQAWQRVIERHFGFLTSTAGDNERHYFRIFT